MMNDTSVKFPKERAELLEMYELDQNIRIHGDFRKVSTDLKMSAIDLKNQDKLVRILAKIKLPTCRNVGLDGAETVWIVAQHSGYNLELMKRVLRLMKQSTAKDEANGYYKGIPYLIDRINIMEGKAQVYGTQFWADPKGYPKPFPISDKQGIEGRRKKYGIRPFSEYKKDIIKASKKNNRDVYLVIY